MNLVEKLRTEQGQRSDGTFARSLGIARSTWTLIRLGKSGCGSVALGAILTHRGDLAGDVIKYLRDTYTQATTDKSAA